MSTPAYVKKDREGSVMKKALLNWIEGKLYSYRRPFSSFMVHLSCMRVSVKTPGSYARLVKTRYI
jgi:hypothetical protein